MMAGWLVCPRCDRALQDACPPRQQPKRLDGVPYDPACFFAELRERAGASRARLARLAAIPPAMRTAAESAALVAALVAAMRRQERRREYQRAWRAGTRSTGKLPARVVAMPARPRTKGVLDGLAKVG